MSDACLADGFFLFRFFFTLFFSSWTQTKHVKRFITSLLWSNSKEYQYSKALTSFLDSEEELLEESELDEDEEEEEEDEERLTKTQQDQGSLDLRLDS